MQNPNTVIDQKNIKPQPKRGTTIESTTMLAAEAQQSRQDDLASNNSTELTREPQSRNTLDHQYIPAGIRAGNELLRNNAAASSEPKVQEEVVE